MSRDICLETPNLHVAVEIQPGSGLPIVALTPRTLDTGLRKGDVLLRWEERALQHSSRDSFIRTVEALTPKNHIATVIVKRADDTLTQRVLVGSFREFWPRLLSAITFFVVALILYFRGPPTRLTRSLVAMLFGGALVFVCTFSATGFLIHLRGAVLLIGLSMLSGCLVQAFLLFPDGEQPRSRALRALPGLIALTGPIELARAQHILLPESVARTASMVMALLLTAAVCGSVAMRYRSASAVERRMFKWILWGVYLAVSPPAVLAVLALLKSRLGAGFQVSTAAFGCIPIALLIGVLRYNLFDINRVITLTAFLSVTIVLALVGALTGLPHVAALAASSLAIPTIVAQSLASLTLLMFVYAGYRALLPWINRTFFRERWSLETLVPKLVGELQAARSPAQLFETLADGVRRTLHPLNIAVYCKTDEDWKVVSANGRAIAPVLAPQSEIIAKVGASAAALVFEPGWAGDFKLRNLYDRSLAEAIGLSVVIPVPRDASSYGLIMLGRKTSGDIYVASEVALLTALAQVASARLASFQLELLVQHTREAHDKLCQYVPSAVTSALSDGQTLDAGEREVTLMFVDIRGYSAYAEGRSVREVFSTINSYTRHVSEIVREHGGHIVEFNGDGMMAVFGAPSPLAKKEEAAVRTALEIQDTLPALGLLNNQPLQVGVGIATGSAYVGSIASVDRAIWTALGETTNRAARLQALTRELLAGVIVDERTCLRAKAVCQRFVPHYKQSLRGLRRKQNIFALPLADWTRARTEPQVELHSAAT